MSEGTMTPDESRKRNDQAAELLQKLKREHLNVLSVMVHEQTDRLSFAVLVNAGWDAPGKAIPLKWEGLPVSIGYVR